MKKVVFETPTLLDLTAVSVFGMSSKPNTNNPIGYFGTGLKYTIAVLVREKIPLSIFIGMTEYVFYKKEGKFRDTNYEQIMMKKRTGVLSRWQYVTLPFTTQLGRNWKLWQVLRELHSNTLDEQGTSYVAQYDPQEDWWNDGPQEGKTKIVVSGEKFLEVFSERDKIFLPGAHSSDKPWDGTSQAEIIVAPSQHVYFRGLRVFDMQKDKSAIYTYNILCPLELTEDRTVKYEFYMMRAICNAIATCTDPVICERIAFADDDQFEGSLDWQWCSVPVGPVMNAAIREAHRPASRIYGYARSYWPSVTPEITWVDRLVKAIREGDGDTTVEIISENREDVIRKLLRPE